MLQQRTAKTRAYAEHARTSLMEAMFQLAALDPLLRDRALLDPLDKTYAANALGVLQWTLLGGAAINLCKVVFDRDDRSASLARLMQMLGDPALVGALRAKRTEPSISYGQRPAAIDVATWEGMKKKWADDDRKAAESEFDATFPSLRPQFEAIQIDPIGLRIQRVRNKVLAHNEVTLKDGQYHGLQASDFGLLWGDVEAFAGRVTAFVEDIFVVLFGHHLAQSETKAIFDAYSKEFWSYMTAELKAKSAAK